MKKRILAFHLLNDFSGSPFVFRQALDALIERGETVELYTATPSGKGFLSDLKNATTRPIFYKWHPNKWLTLMYFFIAQLAIFFKVLLKARRRDVVYINSILPFGAALGGFLRGSSVVYHVHEVSVKPAALKKFLLWVLERTAVKAIYVSQHVMDATPVKTPGQVVYNALPDAFLEKALTAPAKESTAFSVLLLCSLKKYKGVLEFVEAARRLPDVRFVLVANSDSGSINTFFQNESIPSNLAIHPATSNVHPFYANTDMVVNFSRPDEWVETFGMTALEAMVYGKPSIVPPVGGITELIEEGVQGYRISSYDMERIVTAIDGLKSNATKYQSFSQNALERSKAFTQTMFRNNLWLALAPVLLSPKDTKNGVHKMEKVSTVWK
jgi:L-malate glycosyltransferase